MGNSLTALPSLLILAGSGSLIIGLLIWKIKSLLNSYKQKSIPVVEFGKIKVAHPSASQRKGAVRVRLCNMNGGEAVLKRLTLRVADHGASLNPGKIREPQLLDNCQVTVALRSNCQEYPLAMKKNKKLVRGNDAELGIEFRCDEQHWFRMAIDAEWCNSKSPEQTETLSSAQFYLEFPVL
ncbi:hypothetical protein P886_2324 [Alteromonadaceae bacterium 2753L.S.0a.02]|nr:hypothetical protein P886_2324 [Alteromonadaceae bacterium 2753L.S.0a.02]